MHDLGKFLCSNWLVLKIFFSVLRLSRWWSLVGLPHNKGKFWLSRKRLTFYKSCEEDEEEKEEETLSFSYPNASFQTEKQDNLVVQSLIVDSIFKYLL